MAAAGNLDFNEQFLRTLKLIEAGSSVFLTGKAGTGKSTLLRHFLDTTDRRAVVVAPTGVAALNVGGQTIHRLFSFPSFVTADFPNEARYYPGRNGRVIKSLEVLVIDEVSMVRADLIDAVDNALRRYGPHPGEPFGGVQMIFVGDPYQLPPVVLGAEEDYFRSRYATPYFFSADAFRELPYEIVQLEKVYRQRDDEFITLLNAVRTGEATVAEFARLNDRYLPDFEPPDDEFWITLTTTNAMAETVNDRKLSGLASPLLIHHAHEWGEVEPADKPVADALHYKVGAQVMLLNNDSDDRWVNGSVGVVTGSGTVDGKTQVDVELVDGGTVEVQPHTWDITRPVLTESGLSYDVAGSFTQLPFKLAWAVTIHKSQGKTLDRVVVSLGRGTFADGQLYVALSRCTSLSGLVLKSEVKAHHVKVEREVTRFLARSSRAAAAREGYAFVGVLATGTSRFDRVIEIGVVVDREGEVEEYSTLLNPMRDVGNAAGELGITASDLSMAPTFAEAWPWLARRMGGCVFVAHGLPLVQTMMEREVELSGMRVDLGLGIDLQAQLRQGLGFAASATGLVLPEHAGALDLARATAAVFATLDFSATVTTPYLPGEEARLPGRIQSRNTDASTGGPTDDPALAYADLVTLLANQDCDETEAQQTLRRFAHEFSLGGELVNRIHVEALDAMVQAAARDGVTTDVERARISHAAEVMDLPHPRLGAGSDIGSVDDCLIWGARVCFTGSSVDLDGVTIERPELHAIARRFGLEPVDSVTKGACDVLIAADASSMSGKAKKARQYGKPVHSLEEFLQWVSRS